jgi:hypothetical protein
MVQPERYLPAYTTQQMIAVKAWFDAAHSCRIATSGSMAAARRAGIKLAAIATASTKSALRANIAGSPGLTAYNNRVSIFVRDTAPAAPTATSHVASASPWPEERRRGFR